MVGYIYCLIFPGSLQRGSLHGEDGNICYNVSNPCFDLEAHAQGYEGLARLYRLRFIAHHCPVLRIEALKLAISYVMNTHNTALFSELHRKLSIAVSPLIQPSNLDTYYHYTGMGNLS